MAKIMLLMDSEDSKTPIMTPPMKNEIIFFLLKMPNLATP